MMRLSGNFRVFVANQACLKLMELTAAELVRGWPFDKLRIAHHEGGHWVKSAKQS
jgi:hypothetical protein